MKNKSLTHRSNQLLRAIARAKKLSATLQKRINKSLGGKHG